MTDTTNKADTVERVQTGIPGLDYVLHGGLLPRRAYLVRGRAGTGKTTLGLHFLSEVPMSNLFITFSETPEQVQFNAQRVGIDCEAIHFLDLSPGSDFFANVQAYDIFTAAEVEREPITQRIVTLVDDLRPTRIFVDAITQLRFLTNDTSEFRRFVTSFIQFMKERDTTVLFTSEESESTPDDELRFVSDGIIRLETTPHRRMLSVEKFRGSDFQHGYHTVRLTDNGMQVFPRLAEPEHSLRVFSIETISSGLDELDELLHGGLERGTVSLFTGPTGVGKTTLGIQFMNEAAKRGERSVVFTFEEDDRTVIERCRSLKIPIGDMLDAESLRIVQIEPLRFTPDEFAGMVKDEVEQRNTSLVMIDSVAGYELSIQGDNLTRYLHTQCKYLRNMGITTILVNEVHRIVDPFRATEIDISYLMDSIVFLRYFETNSELHRAIGVLKKRVSDFEKSMREVTFSEAQGITVGPPLDGLHGILTGMHHFTAGHEGEE